MNNASDLQDDSLGNQLQYEYDVWLLDQVNFYVNDILGSMLFVFGVIFNIVSFTYFQLSRSFRDTSMRHYFSVLSISDSLRLSEWLFTFLMDKKIIVLNSEICRAFIFITITSGNISVWLLVFLSIERYIILQFPFKGKQIYSTKNSLRMLVVVIALIIVLDIPYLHPSFVESQYQDYEMHLHMCITNPRFRTYMFVNSVLFQSIIPFVILLVFNCLLIGLLAKRKTLSIFDNVAMSAKRERQFKERTVLLISVTFFLVLTVSPRYIVQMVSSYQSLFKVAIAKCLIILEMLNFSMNFLFYIMCSKTSRNEFYLILYYFFYWKWSKASKAIVICNHPNHNRNVTPMARVDDIATISQVNASNSRNTSSVRSNSRMKSHCFLSNGSRLKKTKQASLRKFTNPDEPE